MKRNKIRSYSFGVLLLLLVVFSQKVFGRFLSVTEIQPKELGMFLMITGSCIMLGGDVFRLVLTTKAYFKNRKLIHFHGVRSLSKFGELNFILGSRWVISLLAMLAIFCVVRYFSILNYEFLFLIYFISIFLGIASGVFSSLKGLMNISLTYPTYYLIYGIGLSWKDRLYKEKIVDRIFCWLSAVTLTIGLVLFIFL